MNETLQANDLSRLAQAASESLTDSMVERLTTTGANAMEIVDKLNDEDTRDAVIKLLDGVTDLNRIGALDSLFQLITMLHAARAAVTDNMVERQFVFVEHMINNLANEEIAVLTHNARRALEDAAEAKGKDKPRGGMMATLRMLSRPETQQALQFMLAFACGMRRRTAGIEESLEGS